MFSNSVANEYFQPMFHLTCVALLFGTSLLNKSFRRHFIGVQLIKIMISYIQFSFVFVYSLWSVFKVWSSSSIFLNREVHGKVNDIVSRNSLLNKALFNSSTGYTCSFYAFSIGYKLEGEWSLGYNMNKLSNWFSCSEHCPLTDYAGN